MFSFLAEKLNTIIQRFKSSVSITEKDFEAAMREIRISLIEADVSLEVIKPFITKIKEKVIGQNILKNVLPGQMIVKIVYDELVNILNGENNANTFYEEKLMHQEDQRYDEDIRLDENNSQNSKSQKEIAINKNDRSYILLLGLQGQGKTTTAAKLALFLRNKHKNKKILLVSVDIYRPAAQLQLSKLGKEIGIDVFNRAEDKLPADIIEDVIQKTDHEIVIIDTAGRLQNDDIMIDEIILLKQKFNPVETLLVIDAMIGQMSVDIAREFNTKIGISGIILTKVDGDARGGAALSTTYATGCQIKMICTGEKVKDIEQFEARRCASRILGMQDIVSLVEKVASDIDIEEAKKAMDRMKKNKFDMVDLLSQIRNIKKIGNISNIFSMIPKFKNIATGFSENATSDIFKKYEGIINAMTKQERANPDIINGSRRRRIASGAGVSIQMINKFMKQYYDMLKMMKQVNKGEGKIANLMRFLK